MSESSLASIRCHCQLRFWLVSKTLVASEKSFGQICSCSKNSHFTRCYDLEDSSALLEGCFFEMIEITIFFRIFALAEPVWL